MGMWNSVSELVPQLSLQLTLVHIDSYFSVLMFSRLQAIVAHLEHDTVYVKDPACRSFSLDTLKLFIEIILENMPTGARCCQLPLFILLISNPC